MQRFFYVFQFLLVRLREQSKNMQKPINFISIPSGAIKSGMYCSIVRGRLLFQFLLVRLRVIGASIITVIYHLFQFLLVRLREEEMRMNNYNYENFNSFWCD